MPAKNSTKNPIIRAGAKTSTQPILVLGDVKASTSDFLKAMPWDPERKKHRQSIDRFPLMTKYYCAFNKAQEGTPPEWVDTTINDDERKKSVNAMSSVTQH